MQISIIKTALLSYTLLSVKTRYVLGKRHVKCTVTPIASSRNEDLDNGCFLPAPKKLSAVAYRALSFIKSPIKCPSPTLISLHPLFCGAHRKVSPFFTFNHRVFIKPFGTNESPLIYLNLQYVPDTHNEIDYFERPSIN